MQRPTCTVRVNFVPRFLLQSRNASLGFKKSMCASTRDLATVILLPSSWDTKIVK